jgi:hypothetical protein
VQLAAGAADRAVDAIAVGVCGNAPADAVTTGACQRISLAEWSRIDPDNGIPWLNLAQAARNTGDTQAEAAAFAHATGARKIDIFLRCCPRAALGCAY